MPFDELLSELNRTEWGVWQLEKSNWTLVHTRDSGNYDQEDMNTPGQMLDWIFQISQKAWATREDVGDLIQALDTIFQPQQTLCSGGGSETINASEYLKKRYEKG